MYDKAIMSHQIRCVIHGSFRKHFSAIQYVRELFEQAGVQVLAPKAMQIASTTGGFALFEDELQQDPRLIELRYLHHLKRLGPDGFSYFVNPDGYIGTSTSYELAIAQLTNVRCFLMHKPADHPAYIHKNSVWRPELLAEYIMTHGNLPPELVRKNDRLIHKLWQDLMVPGSVVATGAIIERRVKDKKEILLVKTHKWGNRYSIVGGKVRRNERLANALLREVYEETGLTGTVGRHLLTFDQIKGSGYYKKGVHHVFVDNVVEVENKRVVLNEEAQTYVWVSVEDALRELDIEPNARMTVEAYARLAV